MPMQIIASIMVSALFVLIVTFAALVLICETIDTYESWKYQRDWGRKRN